MMGTRQDLPDNSKMSYSEEPLNLQCLQQSVLDSPLNESTKTTISEALWDHDTPTTTAQRLHTSKAHINLSPYFHYYTKKCQHALHDGGRHVATRTHADIISCATLLKNDVPRSEIHAALYSKLTSAHPNADEMISNSIDLCASLLLMTNFGSYSYGFSGKTCLSWPSPPQAQSHPQFGPPQPPPESQPLGSFVHTYFTPEPRLTPSPLKDHIKLEKIFKASNLSRIANLSITWTDNLADHLRLTDDDTRVHIFHHASFLQAQTESTTCLFPPGLVQETLKTLALLFPSSDRETKQWLDGVVASPGKRGADNGEAAEIDMRITQCGRLKTDDRQIDCFSFWRDRLVMLKQVFDEAQPKKIRQWWYDSRNGVQWYTFWVAVMVLVLTVVFGLIQSVEGALQVYASFKGMPHGGDGGGG
ncbi:hypothetical protein QBC38DRAFT_492589 [Podospora fimiseda]|uniref:Uncharacterized protein n=1 Tax=Podospora fimiseda TaxID=252190 RepID=A0AAN6YLY6_9PEZI|nr:hypothetical protein QBC38DRAFT_492589 [Podospora fimiseda]